ncbi:MAG: tandem-95 repeat protein [Flavobacteriia bacterium]|jgi:hypothetical protein
MKNYIFTVILLITSSLSVAYSQTIRYVSTSGSNSNSGLSETDAFLTINNAVNVSNEFDTIILLPGLYNEAINIDKSLTIASKMIVDSLNDDYYVSNTILDGTDLGTLIKNSINQTSRLHILGLTVQNTPATAVEFVSGAYSKLEKVHFINNGNYGAVVINIIGNTSIEACRFENNLFNTLISLQGAYGGFPKVNRCIFMHNGNPQMTYKSHIYAYNRAKIVNNIFTKNAGVILNGGCNGSMDSVFIEHNTIVDNIGYGIYLDHCGGGIKGFINNNIIERNTLGCLTFISNSGGYSIIKLRNNKLTTNPYYTNQPLQYALTWSNNDTLTGDTFTYPIDSLDDLVLSQFSESIGSGYAQIQTESIYDLYGNPRPFPSSSIPDRGAIENILDIPIHNNVIHVSTDGNDFGTGEAQAPFKTIQAAINYSINGDSILVHPGVYVENIIYNGKNVIITSLFSRNQDTSYISSTIIDGGANGTHSVVRVHGGEVSAQLKGLTIQNGLTVVGNGGCAGINISGSSLIMDYLIIQNNISTNAPGAINLYFANQPSLITNSIIRNNQSGTVSGVGGAIYTWNSNIHIRNCEIYGNQANDISAICFQQGSQNSSDFPIINTLIYNNSSTSRSIYSGDGLTLINCVVADNVGYIGLNGSSFIYNSVIGINNNISNNGTLTINNSIIEGGMSSITSILPQFLVQSNNYFQSAEFINGSNHDFRLKNYSVGVGSGLNSMTINGSIFNAPSNDIELQNRPNPFGSNPDIGAYENALGVAANAPPTINAIANSSMYEDIPFNLDFTGLTDGDINTIQSLTITATSSNTAILSNPTVNYVQGESTGSLSFYPVLNANGQVQITLLIKDDGGLANGGLDSLVVTFQMTVESVNDVPISQDDSGVTDEDQVTTIVILSNDSDVDGTLDFSTIDLEQSAAGIQNSVTTIAGTWAINASNGELTYTPALNYFGPANIFYTILDDQGLVSNVSEVTIAVHSINDGPVTVTDSGLTNEDNSATINLVSNDSDVDGTLDLSTIDLDQSSPGVQNTLLTAEGSWTVDPATGILTYIPAANYNGAATINYTIEDDSASVSNLSGISIMVNPMNDTPTDLNIDNSTVNENIVGLIGIFTTNDIDLGNNFNYTLVSGLGDTDNSLFAITSNQLLNVSAFDFETQNVYSIRVRTTDDSLSSYEKIFNIQVLNLNDIQITEVTSNTLCTGNNASGSISVTIDQFNGNLSYAWTGPNGFSSSSQNISGLDAGDYTLTVTDDFNSQTVTITVGVVPVFSGLEVCYVSSDLITPSKNRIFFKNPGMYNVQYYQILRESSVVGVFDLIGQANASDSSFLDNSSDNSSLSYKYEVRSVDSCGNFSVESSFHKTILLQANLGLGNTVNLSWNAYEGTVYSTYAIYRSINGGAFELLISLPTSNTTFNDGTADVSQNTYKYFVAISVNSCDFTKTISQIRSNQKVIGNASVSEIIAEDINVYPNPTSDIIVVSIPNCYEMNYIDLFDQSGKHVGRYQSELIQISGLQNGTYLMKVVFSDGHAIQKMITKI